jgi:hypothetical protein
MAKSAKVRIELGAAMASANAHGALPEGHTLIVLVYAILVDGKYQGIFSSRAHQGPGPILDDHLFELPAPEGYDGPWDADRFAVGAGSFYRQSFAQTQKLVAETGAKVTVAETLVTERWAFDFEVDRKK